MVEFRNLDLPITPPYPPMEARSVERIPSGPEWMYEPKWDGFRCLAFRAGTGVALQSKAGQPLARYFPELGRIGCDGVIAKLAVERFHSGDRDAMQKIKRLRTADCVVGGYRYASGKPDTIGSLLLGLYNAAGRLDHVGFAASFPASQRAELRKIVEPLRGGHGFTGRAPGGQSRWSTERTGEWEPLKPTLVCEVRYDHFSGGRFRHGTKFLRWRPDKPAKQCTMAQISIVGAGSSRPE